MGIAHRVAPRLGGLELLDHVGLAANLQAQAFENQFAGSMEIPTYPGPVGAEREAVESTLARGRDRFVAAVDGLDESHLEQMTPLPIGLVPTPVALQIAVLEYGYHRWDLERALDGETFELPADIAPHGFEFLGGLLPMLSGAGQPPGSPLAFELRSPGGSLVLEHAGEGWEAAGAPTVESVCTITADVATLALFGMGRVPPTDGALVVDGTAAGEAARFKAYFPGP